MTDAELEGQGSGTGDAGQDVGSPAKKMRMGSGLAHAQDAGSASFASAETPVVTCIISSGQSCTEQQLH